MNIFFLHKDPKKCAIMHVNKHVVKMILESTQMLCSVHHVCKQIDPNYSYTPPYKLAHKNHPCSIWVRESLSNYLWLIELAKELSKEYTYRYGKSHKCESYIYELEKNPFPNDYIQLVTKKKIYRVSVGEYKIIKIFNHKFAIFFLYKNFYII